MKRLISAMTAMCMASTMLTVAAPVVTSAADATKTLSIKTYAQSGSKYAADGNKVTISEADIAAGDVTVPCAVYLTEDTADTQTMSIPLTINSDQADVKNVTFDLIDPAKPYFDEEQTVTSAAGDTLKTKNAIVFAAGLNKMKKYTPTGTSQLTVDDHQEAAKADNYYIGYGWTAPQGYSWTGSKSDDYPVFVFDVTFPKGTAAGDYKLQYCNYIKDAQGNPALMIETDDRYANIGDLKNLVLNEMTITVAGDSKTPATTTTAATTSTSKEEVPVTTSGTADGDIVFDFGSYTAEPGEEVTVEVKLKSGNNHPVASMDVKFDIPAELQLTAMDTSAPAFDNATVEANEDSAQASFISLDKKSEPVIGTDGEVVFTYMVKVPQDSQGGKYKLGFKNCEIYKSGQNSDMWSYSVVGGDFMVAGYNPPPTTTSESSTVNSPSKDGDIVFDFGSYTAEPGEDVTVEVKLKSGNSHPVASMDAKFDIPSGLELTAMDTSSPAFDNATVEANEETAQASFISLDKKSEPVVGTDGEVVFTFMVRVPKTGYSDSYTLGFKNCEIYKSGQNSDMWTYSVEGGKITVSGGSGSTTSGNDVTTSKVTDNSGIVFDFGSYTAKPGDEVNVEVKLANGNNHPVASMDVKFKLDSPLKITAFDTSSAAYDNATVEANEETAQASFISLDKKSEPVVGKDGEVVFNFMVKVPETATAGTYKIGFDNCEIYKSGQNSDKWAYDVLNGAITVTGGTSTTGKEEPTPNGEIVFDFGKYDAKPGDEVNVEVKLAAGNNLPVASMDVKFSLDKSFKITAIDTSSPAFDNATVDCNEDTAQASFISLDKKSEPVIGKDGEVVFNFIVKIPENAAGGTYNIGFDNCEIYKSGQNSDKWKYSVKNGTINVAGGTTSSAATTGSASKADIVFDLGTYNADPGQDVTVSVKLKSGNSHPVASMDAQFAVDKPLKITAIDTSSPAFDNATVEVNEETYQASFISLDKKSEPVVGKDGETVFEFIVSVPKDAKGGTYNVSLKNCEIFKSGQDSAKWTFEGVNGTIKVSGSGEEELVIAKGRVGDLDGDGKRVAIDAALLLRFYAELSSNSGRVATDDEMYVCDCNRNGKIEAGDAAIILKWYAEASGGYTKTFEEYLKETYGVIV
jgi:plastocyanin